MPIVNIGTQKYTVVTHPDPPGFGGACHQYHVSAKSDNPETIDSDKPLVTFADIHFQEGPAKEYGVNGCHNEDLLAIVIHRLQGFQSGAYRCDDNEDAISHIECALEMLAARTLERNKRGVEGTSTI